MDYDAITNGAYSAVKDYLNENCVADRLERLTKPSVLYKPTIQRDGNAWCALLGKDLMIGVAGFGNSPQEAMDEFDKAFTESLEVE